jgi:hypothetical protein
MRGKSARYPMNKIGKIERVPAHLQPVADKVNPIIDIHDRGFVVDTDSVSAERLPDGRVRLHLTDAAKARLYPK